MSGSYTLGTDPAGITSELTSLNAALTTIYFDTGLCICIKSNYSLPSSSHRALFCLLFQLSHRGETEKRLTDDSPEEWLSKEGALHCKLRETNQQHLTNIEFQCVHKGSPESECALYKPISKEVYVREFDGIGCSLARPSAKKSLMLLESRTHD